MLGIQCLRLMSDWDWVLRMNHFEMGLDVFEMRLRALEIRLHAFGMSISVLK